MSALNPYDAPTAADTGPHIAPLSRWRCFGIYASVFMAIYALVVSRVAGPTIINRFTALSPFQRFEYGFQLVDGAGVAIIVTSPVWLLAHRFQNSSLQVLSASVIAVATYLALFISHTPVTFTWAVHGIPLGGARPFWPITGGMLLCSAAAMIVALPIVSGKRILARQSVIRK